MRDRSSADLFEQGQFDATRGCRHMMSRALLVLETVAQGIARRFNQQQSEFAMMHAVPHETRVESDDRLIGHLRPRSSSDARMASSTNAPRELPDPPGRALQPRRGDGFDGLLRRPPSGGRGLLFAPNSVRKSLAKRAEPAAKAIARSEARKADEDQRRRSDTSGFDQGVRREFAIRIAGRHDVLQVIGLLGIPSAASR